MAIKRILTLSFAVLTVSMMSTTAFAHHHYRAPVTATTQCNTTECLVNGVCDGSCTGTGSCANYSGCNSHCNGSQSCLDAGTCSGHQQYYNRNSCGRHHGGCHR